MDEVATMIAKERYFLDQENWEGCANRTAFHLSRMEKDYMYYHEKFYLAILNQHFMPAGRILRNSGRPKGSLLNCYHIPIGDSIEEIGQHTKDSLTLWSEGGGLGTNYSALRPKGDKIIGKGGTSSGLVSFLRASDSFADTIESGGGRRAAGLAHVIIYHPEVRDFIKAKVIDGELSHYNISVATTDKFIDAVKNNGDWTFKFAQRDYDTMKARDLWDLIIYNMVKHGDPGLINWNNFRRNNSYYCAPISGCNPCGEAVLEPFGACDLGSIVLPNFISQQNTNWVKMEETIHLAVRMLDNVLDVNKYALGRIKRNCLAIRRIGIGTMGLADYLFKKEVRYGSEESIAEIDKLYKFIRNTCYEASVELAKEKGAFPMFDSTPYTDAAFVRTLPSSLRDSIRNHGIRNCTIMAMPPTGTTALLSGCEPGVEPMFSKGYWRTDRASKEPRPYVHPLIKGFVKDNKLEYPDWFVDAFDVTPEEHLKVQASIQKYTDGAVSKTINVPNDYDWKEMSKLLLKYLPELKGVTVYRDGSKGVAPLKPMNKHEVKKHLDENIRLEEDVECKGSCQI